MCRVYFIYWDCEEFLLRRYAFYIHKRQTNPDMRERESEKTKEIALGKWNTGKVLIKFYGRKWHKIVTLCTLSHCEACSVIEVAIFVQHILTNLLDFIWFFVCPCPFGPVKWQVNTPVTSSTHQESDTMMTEHRDTLRATHSFNNISRRSQWLLVIIIKVTRYLLATFAMNCCCAWQW